ncbi:MAG: efflux RND transporter periplasmic adaptor subunit, partial [bacterium]|nr:efflux RND transporter periplasmic adaptor subunit [bacterium]
MIEITVRSAQQAPRRHHFEGPRVRIGRDEDNELVLDSRGCSRFHAEIVHDGTSYKIADKGSTNGVLYGSELVKELVLADGMEVMIGEFRLSFNLPDEETSDRTVRLDYRQLASLTAAEAPDAVPQDVPAAPQDVPAVPQPREAPTVPREGSDGEETGPAASLLYLAWGSGRQERILKLAPGPEYIIGRSPSADLVLDDRESSVQHALVTARAGRFIVRDLGSSNGTLVNGRRIQEAAALAAGDEIVIGQTAVRVRDQIHELVDQGHLLERTSRGIPTMPDGVPAPPPLPDEVLLGARRSGGGGRGLAVVLGVVVLLAAAVGVFYLGGKLRKPPDATEDSDRPAAGTPVAGPGETLVQVAPVEVDELVFEVSGSGSVRAHRTATVSAEVAARVEELPAAEGTGVRQGVLLVRLNDRDIQHQLDAARASISREQLDLAKADYERKERLFNDGAVVRSVYEQAKNQYLSLDSAYRSTQAQISRLREQLSKTRILAPISGVVVKTFVNPGELVAPGVPVVALENMEEALVKVDLADRDFVGVQLGQPVEATTDAFPGRVFRGEVNRLGSAANPVTRTFEVEARLLNPDFSLRTGMIVWLRIIQGKEQG